MEKTWKRVLLARTNLNSIEVLISDALIDSYVSHYKLLREYDEIKEETCLILLKKTIV